MNSRRFLSAHGFSVALCLFSFSGLVMTGCGSSDSKKENKQDDNKQTDGGSEEAPAVTEPVIEDNQTNEPPTPPTDLKFVELKHMAPVDLASIVSSLTSTLDASDEVKPFLSADAQVAAAASLKGAFVRGTDDDVEKIKQLVVLFDRPSDQYETANLGDYQFIPLKGTDFSEVESVLSSLGLTYQTLTVGESTFLEIRSSNQQEAKQFHTVLEKYKVLLPKKSQEQPKSIDKLPSEIKKPTDENK